MTWIPCGFCQQAPCICAWRPQQAYPATFTFKPRTYGPIPAPLSDADVERIAERVFEKVRGLLTGFSRVTRRESEPVQFDADDMENSG